MECEQHVAARTAARDFFKKTRRALTLAPFASRWFTPAPRGFLPLTYPRAVVPALHATVFASILAGSIPTSGPPESPPPRRRPTRITAISRLRAAGLKRPLTSLQQTEATPGPMTRRALHPTGLVSMLIPAQGRCQLPNGHAAEQNSLLLRGTSYASAAVRQPPAARRFQATGRDVSSPPSHRTRSDSAGWA